MIELSQEIDINFEIPEEFKSKKVEASLDYEKGYKPNIEEVEEEESSHHILNALKDEDKTEEPDFEFDALDDRFKDLYEDEDFILDASNKKFKMQRSSKKIVEKKFTENIEK